MKRVMFLVLAIAAGDSACGFQTFVRINEPVLEWAPALEVQPGSQTTPAVRVPKRPRHFVGPTATV